MRRGGRLDYEIYINPPDTEVKYNMLQVLLLLYYSYILNQWILVKNVKKI